MRAEVFKPGNIKKLKKDFDDINECDKPVYYVIIFIFTVAEYIQQFFSVSVKINVF